MLITQATQLAQQRSKSPVTNNEAQLKTQLAELTAKESSGYKRLGDSSVCFIIAMSNYLVLYKLMSFNGLMNVCSKQKKVTNRLKFDAGDT